MLEVIPICPKDKDTSSGRPWPTRLPWFLYEDVRPEETWDCQIKACSQDTFANEKRPQINEKMPQNKRVDEKTWFQTGFEKTWFQERWQGQKIPVPAPEKHYDIWRCFDIMSKEEEVLYQKQWQRLEMYVLAEREPCCGGRQKKRLRGCLQHAWLNHVKLKPIKRSGDQTNCWQIAAFQQPVLWRCLPYCTFR